MERKALKRTPLARPRKGFWTCQRKQAGVKCGTVNPNRRKLCMLCNKPKRPKSKPKHMAVLDKMTYEDYIEITGGEVCGICGQPPKAKRLARDHDHSVAKARELLCFRCNILLKREHTLPWMRLAVAYLERVEERWEREGCTETTDC